MTAPLTIGGATLHTGDCREVLSTLPAESVQCVVTSPPYWGLRDYGVDGQIGLEASVTEYVEALVGVFREVRRVLRPEGTLWLNLGDCYANLNRAPGSKGGSGYVQNKKAAWAGIKANSATIPAGLKPKDLIGLPWRVAFALQADGWWLRSDIIWSKPNPMPESVTDRPTKAHEYLFLLAKSERYYFDAEAVREPQSPSGIARAAYPRVGHAKDVYGDGLTNLRNPATDVASRERERAGAGRNIRSVWNIATRPFSGAHFAVFPPELAERCIKAGTSERGCCAACGAPWRRIMRETGRKVCSPDMYGRPREIQLSGNGESSQQQGGAPAGLFTKERVHVGWEPSCACAPAEPAPCTVLDPFAGAFTTCLVAERLGRRSIGLELNPAYVTMGAERLRREAPLFADAAA